MAIRTSAILVPSLDRFTAGATHGVNVNSDYRVEDGSSNGADRAAGACPPGLVQFQTSCYKIEAQAKKQWSDAKKACEAERSHLAVIMTTEENQFVKKELMKRQITCVFELSHAYMQFWMDGIDTATEGTWVWESTGEL
ncbi:C-type lectin domain family 12 member B-like [Dreissena polymorpha]|uniref:C-type lectin domain family 12 member B-like n=1 Tax=Dreissena polymorpha TaxID=45954 RepID=UPI002263E861|nr:C-type lectin domain family 12 member B-like [Dreissena polymorpha]